MPEYPDNSHSARDNNTSPPEKKLEKVVSGGAKTRKKSEVKKFAEIFVPKDTESMKSFILSDVVIPGVRNAIADVVSIILFGESGRVGGRKSGGGSRVSSEIL